MTPTQRRHQLRQISPSTGMGVSCRQSADLRYPHPPPPPSGKQDVPRSRGHDAAIEADDITCVSAAMPVHGRLVHPRRRPRKVPDAASSSSSAGSGSGRSLLGNDAGESHRFLIGVNHLARPSKHGVDLRLRGYHRRRRSPRQLSRRKAISTSGTDDAAFSSNCKCC